MSDLDRGSEDLQGAYDNACAEIARLVEQLHRKPHVEIRLLKSAPSGEDAQEPAEIEVHEGSWALIIGTNGKPAGWIDTHELFASQLYRDNILPALSPVVAAPEPVAWRWKKAGYGGYRYSSDKDEADHAEDVRTVEPLYSADRIDTLEREKRLLAGKLSISEARIAELEAALRDARMQALASDGQAQEALGRVAEMEAALKPFARIADMEENAPVGESVIINVERCRDARSALSKSEPVKQ